MFHLSHTEKGTSISGLTVIALISLALVCWDGLLHVHVLVVDSFMFILCSSS